MLDCDNRPERPAGVVGKLKADQVIDQVFVGPELDLSPLGVQDMAHQGGSRFRVSDAREARDGVLSMALQLDQVEPASAALLR